MKARMLILAALALTPIAALAHDDAHKGMMQGMMPGMMQGRAEGGHSGDGGHAQGVGMPGDPQKVSRTINVVMSDDMQFTPARINAKRGDTIKFVVRNVGKIKHEMLIGSMTELKEHAAVMKKHPGMEHDEPYMAHVAPGKTQSITWQFTKHGEFNFGCLIPGHFEAGMIGKVTVKH